LFARFSVTHFITASSPTNASIDVDEFMNETLDDIDEVFVEESKKKYRENTIQPK